ncbi:unnamed protein product [Soboliphyme baturini]|uniref:Nucleoporin_C domain-containing protein n=1 Tax=Soboliphyme baturini TaxID=241478 RepID=A0A183IZR2_9BILA|nr:unnamed protein product [Soboliphyme baturini]
MKLRSSRNDLYIHPFVGDVSQSCTWLESTEVTDALLEQYEMCKDVVQNTADSSVKAGLLPRLCDLVDWIVSAKMKQMRTAPKPRHETGSLSQSLQGFRLLCHELIFSLYKLGDANAATTLATKFCDYETLIDIYEDSDRPDLLQDLQHLLSDPAFADALYGRYVKRNKISLLLSQCGPHLERFVSQNTHLGWLLHIKTGDFAQASEELLTTARNENQLLSRRKRAKVDPSKPMSIKEIVEICCQDVKVDENILYRALSIICEDWHHDFLPQEMALNLKNLIYRVALSRIDWDDVFLSDDPLDKSSNSVFARLLDLVFAENKHSPAVAALILPNFHVLAGAPEFSSLVRNPKFSFVLQAYEELCRQRIEEAQSENLHDDNKMVMDIV